MLASPWCTANAQQMGATAVAGIAAATLVDTADTADLLVAM